MAGRHRFAGRDLTVRPLLAAVIPVVAIAGMTAAALMGGGSPATSMARIDVPRFASPSSETQSVSSTALASALPDGLPAVMTVSGAGTSAVQRIGAERAARAERERAARAEAARQRAARAAAARAAEESARQRAAQQQLADAQRAAQQRADADRAARDRAAAQARDARRAPAPTTSPRRTGEPGRSTAPQPDRLLLDALIGSRGN